MTTSNANDGLSNLVAGVGVDKDKRTHSEYTLITLGRGELDSMYRTSWLSKRVVNCIADDMTRKWRDIQIDDDKGLAVKAIRRTEKRLNVRGKVNEAIRWSRLYGGSVILIGTDDAKSDPNVLSTPLRVETIKQNGLRYLQVLDRWRLSPSAQVVTDITSTDFGMPESYTVAESGIVYHHSRVIRFDGQKLPYLAWLSNARWDDSELMHVKDAVTTKDTASAVISSLLFEAKVDVITIPDLASILAMDGGEKKISDRFAIASMMKSINNTLIIGDGETYDQKTLTFSNIADVLDKFIDDVCGAAEIPRTRLFGQSPGGLNSTGDGDLQHYYDTVSARQESDLRPRLEKLDQILIRSAIGDYPDDVDFEFCSLWSTSDEIQSKIDYSKAQRDEIYIRNGVVTEGVVARTLHETGTYSGMSDDDVKLAESLVAAAPTVSGEVNNG